MAKFQPDTQVETKQKVGLKLVVGILFFAGLGATIAAAAFTPAPTKIIAAPEPVEPVFAEMAGWPKPIDWYSQYAPLAVNLDSDAKLEIVAGARYKLYVYDDNGRTMPGWPYTFGDDSFIWSASAATDLDQDAQAEIVVATGRWWGTGKDRIYVFNHDGTVVNGWPKDIGTMVGGDSLAVGDVNKDNKSEIVAVSWQNHKIYVFDGLGNILTGWPQASEWPSHQAVIADLDNNGANEIVYGSHSVISVYNSDGSKFGCWPHSIGDYSGQGVSQVSVDDIDKDGKKELVFSVTSIEGVDDGLYAFNDDCTPVSGWPVLTETTDASKPIIGDLDGDGYKEIVYKFSNSLDSGHNLLIISHDGKITRTIPMYDETYFTSDFYRPSLADINADGKLEILAQSNRVIAWDYLGHNVENFPINYQSSSYSEVLAADVNADKSLELIFFQYDSPSKIHIYTTGYLSRTAQQPWFKSFANYFNTSSIN